MRVITTSPVRKQFDPSPTNDEYWIMIDGTNDLQVRHFQVWANNKKNAGLKVNGRMTTKTKNAYAAFGTEWLQDYKKAYPNLSTTNPQGQKVKGKLWDKTKNAWVVARDSGLLQQGLDALGINYQLPTAPVQNTAVPTSTIQNVQTSVNDLDDELGKEKSKKFIKQVIIFSLVIVGGYVGYTLLSKKRKAKK